MHRAKKFGNGVASLGESSWTFPVDVTEITRADSLVEQLTRDARRIQKKAEAAEDYRGALAGVREVLFSLACGAMP
jgi:hypothetical protein